MFFCLPCQKCITLLWMFFLHVFLFQLKLILLSSSCCAFEERRKNSGQKHDCKFVFCFCPCFGWTLGGLWKSWTDLFWHRVKIFLGDLITGLIDWFPFPHSNECKLLSYVSSQEIWRGASLRKDCSQRKWSCLINRSFWDRMEWIQIRKQK